MNVYLSLRAIEQLAAAPLPVQGSIQAGQRSIKNASALRADRSNRLPNVRSGLALD